MRGAVVAVGLVGAVAAAVWATRVPAAPSPTGPEARHSYYESYRLEREQNYRGAIRALNTVPRSYLHELRLGWLYYLDGDYAQSRQHYQAAIKMAPASVEARLGYMLPLLAEKRYRETEVAARQVLRNDPFNYYASLRLTYALRLQKKLGPAEEIAERMLQMYPTDVAFLTEMALLKLAQGQGPAALRLFETVITLDPRNVTARRYIPSP